MPLNLGEISELDRGLGSLYRLIRGYRKVKKVTGEKDYFLESIERYYKKNKRISTDLKKKKSHITPKRK